MVESLTPGAETVPLAGLFTVESHVQDESRSNIKLLHSCRISP